MSGINDLVHSIGALEKAESHHGSGDAFAHAKHIKEHVIPAMLEVRKAADMLEISPDDLEIVDAVVTPKGDPERGIPLAQIAMAAYFAPPPGEDEGLRSSALFEQPAGGWSGGTHACVVEVDPGGRISSAQQ